VTSLKKVLKKFNIIAQMVEFKHLEGMVKEIRHIWGCIVAK